MRKVAFWLSLILMFVIPWENAVLLEGLGTAGKATGLLVAAFWILTVVVTGRFRKPHPFLLAVYLFVLWNTVSVFWSVDVDFTVVKLLTYFQLVGLVWILWDLYTTPAALKAGLQAYVLGAYVSVGSTVANYLSGIERTYLRYAAAGFNPDDIGVILALGIPVAWHLAVSEGHGKMIQVLRLVNYVYIPAALFAIALTGTRTAFMATLPAPLFILASFTRLKLFSRVLISTALVGALFALQPLAPQSSLQRFATTGTTIAEGDVGGRGHIWREGIAVFLEHPLVGVGCGGFRRAVESGKVAHSSYVSVLVEVGIVGFVLFVIMLAMAAYATVRQPKWASRFWLTVLLAVVIGNAGLTWEKRKPTWLFLGLAVVSANLPAWCNQSRLHSGVRAELKSLPEGKAHGANDDIPLAHGAGREKEVCPDYAQLQGEHQHNIIKYGETVTTRGRKSALAPVRWEDKV